MRFEFVSEGSTALRVTQSSDGAAPLVIPNIKVPKNGYAYVYLSNENSEAVYFDDFKVAHTRGRIIEENHYYAFGLKIAGISSAKFGDEKEGSLKNDYLYNDKELWDDADLNWYDYGFRNYDPQVGRFPQLDPLTWDYPYYTPYQYAGNEPIANVDLDGLEPFDALGGIDWVGKAVTLEPVVLKGVSKAAPAITNTASKSIAQGALNSLLKTPLNGISSTRLPDELREIAAPKPVFWQTLNAFSSVTNNLPGQIIYGIANDGYIFGKSYSQGHRGLVTDLSGNVVGSKERLSAGMNTFQLFMGPADIAAVGVTSTARYTSRLGGTVKNNFERFVKRMPANAKSNASFQQLDNGNYLFQATSPGRVPGSKAVYQKWVNPKGETFKMIKTTFAPDGSVIHVKPKL